MDNDVRDHHRGPWPYELDKLRLAAITVPVSFLVLIDILRHTLFSEQLHSIPGFIAVYAVICVAVTVFSYTLFGFIKTLQTRIVVQSQQSSALNEIAAASSAKLKLEALLDNSLDHILSKLHADAALICLLDMEKEEHTAVCSRGFSQEMVGRLQKAKLQDDPIAREVVRTKRPVIFEKVFSDPAVAEKARREGIKAGISAPLMSDGEVNGILAIATREERQFSESDEEFLRAISGQLGMAIRNSVLYEQAQMQNREMSGLLAVGKVATSSFDLDELLSSSLDTIMDVTSTDASEVWLAEDGDDLVMRCHRGAHEAAFWERARFHAGEGIPGAAAVALEPIIVHDLGSDPRFLRHKVAEAGFNTFCALPLRYRGKLVGILTVAALSPDALKGAWGVRLLEGIGEWLALAIANTQLYRQVQDVAVLQERERLAREMHDGMAQLLGYINTQTIAVRKLLMLQQHDQAREQLSQMEDVARDLYADVREGILGLRTVAVGQGGLLRSLRDYAEHYMHMSDVEVDIKATDDADCANLAPSAEVQLMRIVQEALTNVRKHAQATKASVEFRRVGNSLWVVIRDNGHGFTLGRLPSTGWPRFGLQTMRERAEAIGGSLSVESSPGQGTTVQVRIPVAAGERESV